MVPDPYTLNLRHLRAMATVARRGTLVAAADQVGISQPALTAAIAGLEERLMPLFARTRAGMQANEAGLILTERVEEAFVHLGTGLRSGQRQRGFAEPERLVTTSQLRALLALADEGSFVGAASTTGLSQPALHRSIRDIERLTGVPLIERRGRRVALTHAGRKAARGFRLGLGALRAGLVEIAALHGEVAHDQITVGAMPLCRARLLPGAIAALLSDQSDIRVTVIEGAHRELIEQLRDGQIDMAVGALRDPSPGADLEQEPLLIDRLAIVGRGGHPLAGPRRPSRAELARYRWLIGLPGTPLRSHWEQLFAGGPMPVAPIDCGSVMVLRAMLMSGDFLTLLSPEQIGMELRTGMLALVGPSLEDHVRTIGMTSRAGWRPTSTQQKFITMLREEGSRIQVN
jgi:LysR family transcriptional regulator, regulator for genes of the gallate degradation pathway